MYGASMNHVLVKIFPEAFSEPRTCTKIGFKLTTKRGTHNLPLNPLIVSSPPSIIIVWLIISRKTLTENPSLK